MQLPTKTALLCLLGAAGSASGFVAPIPPSAGQPPRGVPSGPAPASRSATELYNHKLVLVRHGESEWNDLNIFTGWADAPLNAKGLSEAAEGGKYLREAGYAFDVAYTSVLKRAIKTLWVVLEELDLMYIPIVSARPRRRRSAIVMYAPTSKRAICLVRL